MERLHTEQIEEVNKGKETVETEPVEDHVKDGALAFAEDSKNSITAVPISVVTDNGKKFTATILSDTEGAHTDLSAVNETNKAVDHALMESLVQASFAFYNDLPLNSNCSETVDNKQGCQPCKIIRYMMDYFKSLETNSSSPDLVLIPMDLLAALPKETPGFSEMVLNVADHVVNKEKYIRFGGSDHIFMCFLPGCKRVLTEILDKHELGKKTRAMWMGMQADLEDLWGLWPCPNRVMTAPPAIAHLISNSFKESSVCENPSQAAMSVGMASILERGAAMIGHTNRWMCSRSQWNVNLDHLKYSPLKGCILIQRHNMCVAIVPKCGSSTMIHVLRRMEGIPEWNNTHHRTHDTDNGMKWIHPSQFEKYKQVLLDTNILKVGLVREPAERLLSGYMDKIYILREFYRIGYEGKSVPSLEWVVDRLSDVQYRGRLNSLDEHFRPIIDFGSMRHLRYDFVAKVSSFAEDLETILSSLGLWKRYGASGWGDNGDQSFGNFMSSKKARYNVGKPKPREMNWTSVLLDKVHRIYEEDYSRFAFEILQPGQAL